MAEPLSQGLGSKSWELFGMSIGSISMGGLGGIEGLELFGMSIGSISMGGLGSMDNMISNGMPPGEYSASAYIPCRIHFWWNM